MGTEMEMLDYCRGMGGKKKIGMRNPDWLYPKGMKGCWFRP